MSSCTEKAEQAARDFRAKRPELAGADLVLMQAPPDIGDWVILHIEPLSSKNADKVLQREGKQRDNTDCYLAHVGPTDVLIGWLSRWRREEPKVDDACEWDPETNTPAKVTVPSHAQADLIVGANGEWRLCRSCAALPQFAKYRKRTEVRR